MRFFGAPPGTGVVSWLMTTHHAFNFLLIGLGMIAGPAVWPEYFGDNHMRSAIWLVFMGSMQAAGGSFFLVLEGLRLSQRLTAWVGDPLDLTISLTDVRRAVLPPSFYSRLEDSEEVALARRLQRQLRQAA